MYGELCTNENNLASPCRSGRKRSLAGAFWRGAGRFVTWLGLAAAGLLALPDGILMLLICAVWSLTDRVSAWMNRKGEK